MTRKAVQYFSDEALERSRKMTPEDIVKFLEEFRELHGKAAAGRMKPVKSRLISMKVPEDLLAEFKKAAERDGTPYQSRIKLLMREWLASNRGK